MSAGTLRAVPALQCNGKWPSWRALSWSEAAVDPHEPDKARAVVERSAIASAAHDDRRSAIT